MAHESTASAISFSLPSIKERWKKNRQQYLENPGYFTDYQKEVFECIEAISMGGTEFLERIKQLVMADSPADCDCTLRIAVSRGENSKDATVQHLKMEIKALFYAIEMTGLYMTSVYGYFHAMGQGDICKVLLDIERIRPDPDMSALFVRIIMPHVWSGDIEGAKTLCTEMGLPTYLLAAPAAEAGNFELMAECTKNARAAKYEKAELCVLFAKLSELLPVLSKSALYNLQIAHSAMRGGHKEQALRLFNALLKSPEKELRGCGSAHSSTRVPVNLSRYCTAFMLHAAAYVGHREQVFSFIEQYKAGTEAAAYFSGLAMKSAMAGGHKHLAEAIRERGAAEAPCSGAGAGSGASLAPASATEAVVHAVGTASPVDTGADLSEDAEVADGGTSGDDADRAPLVAVKYHEASVSLDEDGSVSPLLSRFGLFSAASIPQFVPVAVKRALCGFYPHYSGTS